VIDEEITTYLWSRLEILYMTKGQSNKLYLKKQLYGLHIKQEIAVLEHLNKVISQLLAVDVNIDKDDKTLILFILLLESYNHIITIMLYDKEALILEEVTTTLLSNKIRKRLNQVKQEGLDLVIMGRKEREGKKSPASSKTCHFL